MEKFDALQKRILEEGGAVRCELSSTNGRSVHDSLLNMIESIDNLWISVDSAMSQIKEIDKDLAQRILKEVFSRDMAYRSKKMDEEPASELASDFCSLFDGDAKFFSNQSEDFLKFQQRQITAAPMGVITGATFNTGVFGVDNNLSGFVLVEDED